jgi:hypothetical protein
LYRDRRFYTSNGRETAVLSDTEWADNRFTALQALQTLSRVAVAMTKSSTFQEECRWTFTSPAIDFPYLRNRGPKTRFASGTRVLKKPYRISETDLAKTEAQGFTDRAKLAGILRAQPAAHVFEHRKFHDCTLAIWADLVYEDQVAAYKKLRDYRARDAKGVLKAARPRADQQVERIEFPQPEPGRDEQNWVQQFLNDLGESNVNNVDAQSVSSASQRSQNLDLSDDYCIYFSDADNDSVYDTGMNDDSIYDTGMDDVYEGTEDPDYSVTPEVAGYDSARNTGDNTSTCNCVYGSAARQR